VSKTKTNSRRNYFDFELVFSKLSIRLGLYSLGSTNQVHYVSNIRGRRLRVSPGSGEPGGARRRIGGLDFRMFWI
jgi:hypothetical protein